MPIVYVYGLEGRSIERKRRLVKGVTEAVCDAYDVPADIVTVYLFDQPPENCGHGGVLVADSAPDP